MMRANDDKEKKRNKSGKTKFAKDPREMSRFELLRELELLSDNDRERSQSHDELSSLVHELEVHQIELELQNRELQESHRLLEESRSRYIDLYDFAPVGYVTLDSIGCIQEINLTAATLLEAERTRLIGHSLSRWIHADDRPVFSAHLQNCMVNAEGATCELRLSASRNGRPVYAQLYSVPMIDFGTGVNVYRTAMIDLTERKRVEEAEAISRVLKEERVLRETFVSTLAHDLRTPVTAIRMSAQLLEFSHADPDACKISAAKIVEDADRMDQMIRDLLDVSRIQAGKNLPLKLKPCELTTLVRHTLEKLSVVHGNRFVFKDEKLIHGYWDWDGLRRALENLINNALKYGCAHSQVTVVVKQIKDRVRISVHNLGNPLSQDEQVNLFKPFSRASSAKNSGKKGWGLGLTLVQGVARSHGGSVSVKSSEDEGTTFTLDVPLDAHSFEDKNF